MTDVIVFWSVVKRDPWLFFGLVAVAAGPALAQWRIYTCLRQSGFRYGGRFALPAYWWGAYVREYARTRREHDWPAWPLHLMWIAFVVGIPLVIVGIYRL